MVTDDPIYGVVKLQNEVMGITIRFPIRENITPHNSHLNILKFPDIVTLYTCFFMIIYVTLNSPILYYHYIITNKCTYTTCNALHSQFLN